LITEKEVINNVSNEIGIPAVDTTMSKTIPQSDIYKYNFYEGVRGFTAVKEQGANSNTLFENIEGVD